MKSDEKKDEMKSRARGGVQALGLGPRGVSEDDSPVINAIKRKQNDRTGKA